MNNDIVKEKLGEVYNIICKGCYHENLNAIFHEVGNNHERYFITDAHILFVLTKESLDKQNVQESFNSEWGKRKADLYPDFGAILNQKYNEEREINFDNCAILKKGKIAQMLFKIYNEAKVFINNVFDQNNSSLQYTIRDIVRLVKIWDLFFGSKNRHDCLYSFADSTTRLTSKFGEWELSVYIFNHHSQDSVISFDKISNIIETEMAKERMKDDSLKKIEKIISCNTGGSKGYKECKKAYNHNIKDGIESFVYTNGIVLFVMAKPTCNEPMNETLNAEHEKIDILFPDYSTLYDNKTYDKTTINLGDWRKVKDIKEDVDVLLGDDFCVSLKYIKNAVKSFEVFFGKKDDIKVDMSFYNDRYNKFVRFDCQHESYNLMYAIATKFYSSGVPIDEILK